MSVQIKQSFQTVRVCFWSEERKRRGKDWQSLGVAGPSGARLLKCQDLSKCDNNNVCAEMKCSFQTVRVYFWWEERRRGSHKMFNCQDLWEWKCFYKCNNLPDGERCQEHPSLSCLLKGERNGFASSLFFSWCSGCQMILNNHQNYPYVYFVTFTFLHLHFSFHDIQVVPLINISSNPFYHFILIL